MNNEYYMATLKECPQFYDKTISLIEDCFGYPPQYKFSIDFYPLVSIANHHNNYILVDNKNNDVIGHVGILNRYLGNNDFKTPIALLGGFAVQKNYRNRSFLKKILNHVISLYQDKVSLFLLWGNLKKLHNGLGFYEAGGFIQTGNVKFNHQAKQTSYQKINFAQLPPDDLKQIKYIYNNITSSNYTTILREEKDWKELQKISSIDLFVKKNQQKKIISYFCINKGFDLPDIIHEVGYLPEYKDETILELSNYKLWLPESRCNNLTYKKKLFSAFFRIGSTTLLNKFLSFWSMNELKIIKFTNGKIVFSHKTTNYETTTENFLVYLFGPGALCDFENYGPPLYIAGTDSV